MGETPNRKQWGMTPAGLGAKAAPTPIGGRITSTPLRFTNAAGETPLANKWNQTPGGVSQSSKFSFGAQTNKFD